MNKIERKGVFQIGIFNNTSSNYFTTGNTIQGIIKKAPQLRLGAPRNMWR